MGDGTAMQDGGGSTAGQLETPGDEKAGYLLFGEALCSPVIGFVAWGLRTVMRMMVS